jgi:predicted RNA polymerase sigma factor
MVGDVGLAEELAQEALLAALEQWPRDGVPDAPAAWLTTVARRRAVDHLRRSRRLEVLDVETAPAPAAPAEDPDDVLRLMFLMR